MEILLVEDIPQYQDMIARQLHQAVSVPFNLRSVGNIEEGVTAIHEQMPQLLLLDINLPDGTGFELLERIGLERFKFKLVFISAHDGYAVKAFKFSAIDYVLKPINPLDFQSAVSKAMEFKSEEEQLKLDALQSNLQAPSEIVKKIILKDAESIYLIDIENIIRCESANNYTIFHLADKRKVVVSATLKEYNKLLKSKYFFRSHQSHLINLKYFNRYDKREGGYIVLKDQSVIPLSRGRKDLLMEKLEVLVCVGC